jgi:tetratricopeptide (TPR) repeat protein
MTGVWPGMIRRGVGARRSKRWLRVAFVAATMPAVTGALAGAQSVAAPQVQRAVALFERGDYSGAKAVLSTAAGGAAASYYLGRIAVIEDRAEDAVALFERAISVDGRNADYHLWLGIALGLQARDAGRFRQAMLAKRARVEFERAVALDPRSIGAHEGLVRYYSMAPGIVGGSIRKARDHAAEIARVSPLRGRIASGMIHERERDFAGAEREYLAASSISPDSAAALLALGSLYQRMEQWDKAFAVYERAKTLRGAEFPDVLSAHYQFGRTGALSGRRLEDSERSLKRWIERAPAGTSGRRVARTRARLGMVYARQGRQDLARTEFEAALKLNPKDADARAGLAKLAR